VIAARVHQRQNQVLGQIALAHFANVQGLHAIGDSAWSNERFRAPVIGARVGCSARSRRVRSRIRTSSCRSTVQLIIAQRNFQANADHLTADEITKRSSTCSRAKA